MDKYHDYRFCSIINNICPDKTDGEVNYCVYYCKLYKIYADYCRRSEKIKR